MGRLSSSNTRPQQDIAAEPVRAKWRMSLYSGSAAVVRAAPQTRSEQEIEAGTPAYADLA